MRSGELDRTLLARVAAALAPAAMVLGILALYCPIELFGEGRTLAGADFLNLHERRIGYVQESLFGDHPRLPAWHTRELMGSPFWSNIQSFPFLPTRLALLWLDPSVLYPAAVNLAAVLAAVFTYLYCRKLGLRPLASAAAGWTFSASGYFASRVLAGYLPLLEAFWALPLLLWILECIAQSDGVARRLWLRHVVLALAVLFVVLAGHPQIPAYALATAGLYTLVRMGLRRAFGAGLAMLAGVGLGGFVWWPMIRLIGRSTRVLDLEPAPTDVRYPFWRLKSFLLPWADGWPSLVARYPAREFVDPKAVQIFWDTVCYVGLLPLLAVLFFAARALWIRRRPSAPWSFLAVVAGGALLLALPIVPLGDAAGPTLLRSPSRLLYLTTFGLAMATGAFLDLLLRSGSGGRRRLATGLATLALLVHVVDLSTHDGHFVVCGERASESRERIESWRRKVGDRRVAFDYDGHFGLNRRIDDVGFFDSIVLARPYRAILAMVGAPETTNVQNLDGARLPGEALAGLCVEQVFTRRRRDDLPLLSDEGVARMYAVPDPAARVVFAPDSSVRFLDEVEILARFRGRRADLRREICLSPASRPADLGRQAASAGHEPVLRYDRPDSDHMVIGIRTESPGYVRILETWDEGWTAALDGEPAEILLADAFAMAVRVTPGEHEIRLAYETPGARAGVVLSAVSAVVLVLLACYPGLRGRGVERAA